MEETRKRWYFIHQTLANYVDFHLEKTCLKDSLQKKTDIGLPTVAPVKKKTSSKSLRFFFHGFHSVRFYSPDRLQSMVPKLFWDFVYIKLLYTSVPLKSGCCVYVCAAVCPQQHPINVNPN